VDLTFENRLFIFSNLPGDMAFEQAPFKLTSELVDVIYMRRTYLYVRVRARIYAHIYVYVYICMCIHIHICVHIYLCICVRVYIYECIRIYVRMYMFTWR